MLSHHHSRGPEAFELVGRGERPYGQRTVFQVTLFRALLGLAVLASLLAPLQAIGQEEHKNKLPGLDKITSGGPTRQAFTGKVQIWDKQREILNVNSVDGNDVEIFPIKKKVHVATANGHKMNLAALRPGTSVLVYYEQKGDHRSVQQIVVLTSPPSNSKKKPRGAS